MWREKVFLPLLHEERVCEKSWGVSTLRAAEPPFSVNNGPIKQNRFRMFPFKKKIIHRSTRL